MPQLGDCRTAASCHPVVVAEEPGPGPTSGLPSVWHLAGELAAWYLKQLTHATGMPSMARLTSACMIDAGCTVTATSAAEWA